MALAQTSSLLRKEQEQQAKAGDYQIKTNTFQKYNKYGVQW